MGAARPPGRLLLLGAVALVAAVLAGCGHLAVPVRTSAAYRNKAVAAAESAASAVAAVRLLAETAADGSAFATYTALAIADQQDTLEAVRTGFSSLQPPHDDVDQLGAELIGLLDAAANDVTAARVAARRGQRDTLSALAVPLAQSEAALTTFAETNR